MTLRKRLPLCEFDKSSRTDVPFVHQQALLLSELKERKKAGASHAELLMSTLFGSLSVISWAYLGMGICLCVSATPLRGIRMECGHDEKYIKCNSPQWGLLRLLLHNIAEASQSASVKQVEQSSPKHLILSVMNWDALQMQLLT